MRSATVMRVVLVGLLSTALTGLPTQASAATASDPPAAAVAGSSLAPSADRSNSERRYAEREAKNPQSADFQGGEGFGLYIGGSAVTVLLLIILVVILL